MAGLSIVVCVRCRVKDHKARNKIASAVITMSLAGPWSKSLNDAIDATSAAGIVVVTAAGGKVHAILRLKTFCACVASVCRLAPDCVECSCCDNHIQQGPVIIRTALPSG
jgi:hypothetical protein